MYEQVPVVSGSLEHHLWGYRPQISLLHVRQALEQQKIKCPILRQFLEEVSALAGAASHVFIVIHLCLCTLGARTACNSVPSRYREAAAQALQYVSPSTGSQGCPGKDCQPVY